MVKFQNYLEDDEHQIMMIRKAKTGETLDFQIREAIKSYVKKLKENK